MTTFQKAPAVLYALVLGLLNCAAWAGPQVMGSAAGKSIDYWRALTRADVDAAARLLEENHPGASPEADDAEFRSRLAENRAQARARAAQVRGYPGYVATLSAFAIGIGDRHVGFLEQYYPASLDWPGFLLARRGTVWTVADEDQSRTQASLIGATLVSCDGEPADDFARRTLGVFRGVWSVEAQRIRTAPWLLVDANNPFLARPKSCVFSQNGSPTTVSLEWSTISRATLRPRMRALSNGGSPGFGVEPFGEGWWINLADLSDDARVVVAAVSDRVAAIRAAPLVVLDVRGNYGGNSLFGRQIANAVYGEAHVRLRLGEVATAAHCPTVWRISPDNLKALDSYKSLYAEAGESAAWEKLMADAKAAIKAHRDLTAAVRCDTSTSPSAAGGEPHPAFAGRLVLLTDHECFSSCLLVVQDFRKLGAIQVGEATDQATHYTEERVIPLPSGLGMFSTVQALDPALPKLLGPFVPAAVFAGSIADTQAVKQWIQSTYGASR